MTIFRKKPEEWTSTDIEAVKETLHWVFYHFHGFTVTGKEGEDTVIILEPRLDKLADTSRLFGVALQLAHLLPDNASIEYILPATDQLPRKHVKIR